MQLNDFDLVASLQALPETDPIEIDGVQFGHGGGGGGGARTCNSACLILTVNVLQTVCAVFATCA
ncbi:MAG: VenA family class IV lanthipeptide [Streptosporangiales bacterium]